MDKAVWDWLCAEFDDPVLLDDATRHHPGDRTGSFKVRLDEAICYVKVHARLANWACEVHGYERWARTFGDFAPQLLSVKESPPYALVVSELKGQILEDVSLSLAEETAVWHSAGRALAQLHALPKDTHFGLCHRDGSPVDGNVQDAVTHVSDDLNRWLSVGWQKRYLDTNEAAIVRDALQLVSAFEGEQPTACHRDYCPANWLAHDGHWTGVIDFEFAYWECWTADFSRYPNWNWVEKPELLEAVLAGYGRAITPKEEQQLLVAHVQYALGAIVWGCSNDYFGFAADGRKGLAYLGKLLRG